MSKLELFHRIIVRDKDGMIEFDSGLVPSNSWTIAFLEHLYGAFRDGNVSIEDITNTSRTVPRPFYGSYVRFEVDAPDDNDKFGIVVGTGTTVPTNTDYALATQIAHGTGAGQLDYGAHAFIAPAVVSGAIDMVVGRSFYNGSGSSITVKEVGIYCRSYTGTGAGTPYYFCLARDVLGTPQDVADTKTLTIQYTLRTTV